MPVFLDHISHENLGYHGSIGFPTWLGAKRRGREREGMEGRENVWRTRERKRKIGGV